MRLMDGRRNDRSKLPHTRFFVWAFVGLLGLLIIHILSGLIWRPLAGGGPVRSHRPHLPGDGPVAKQDQIPSVKESPTRKCWIDLFPNKPKPNSVFGP